MREILVCVGLLAAPSCIWADVLPQRSNDLVLIRINRQSKSSHTAAADQLPRQLRKVRLQVAQLAQTEVQKTPQATPSESQRITAALAQEPIGEPLSSFPADTPKLYLRWQGEAVGVGDKIRCAWIAEDVGDAAPANYQINETVTTAGDPRPFGTFMLSRPKKGWPIGKYRAEIYVGDKLAETVRFTIGQTEP